MRESFAGSPPEYPERASLAESVKLLTSLGAISSNSLAVLKYLASRSRKPLHKGSIEVTISWLTSEAMQFDRHVDEVAESGQAA
jgi:hypothetical protein